jgi:sporulation protein YlmC with PRC-barrel domain
MENTDNVLIGKTVLDTKGIIIGVIQQSIKDEMSGDVVSVLIKPAEAINLQRYTVTNTGQIIFPFSALSSVKDVIIVDEPHL